mgnify:CR=1 FL=1
MRVEMAWSTTRSVACVWACTAATYPSGRKGCRGVSLKWRGTLGGAGIGENDTQARGVQAPVDGVDACAALVAHDLIDPAPAGQGAHGRLVRRPGLGQQGHAAAKGMSHDPAPRARAQSPASVTGGDHRGGDVDVLGPPPHPGPVVGAVAHQELVLHQDDEVGQLEQGVDVLLDVRPGLRAEVAELLTETVAPGQRRDTAWSAPAVGGPGGSGRCPERRTRTETGRRMTLS